MWNGLLPTFSIFVFPIIDQQACCQLCDRGTRLTTGKRSRVVTHVCLLELVAQSWELYWMLENLEEQEQAYPLCLMGHHQHELFWVASSHKHSVWEKISWPFYLAVNTKGWDKCKGEFVRSSVVALMWHDIIGIGADIRSLIYVLMCYHHCFLCIGVTSSVFAKLKYMLDYMNWH